MLYLLYAFSKSRKFWVILILSVTVLEGTSVLIQYFFLIKPCIPCIYQRCALGGIAIAGIIAIIAPDTFLLRFFGILLWIYSSIQGLYLALKQINILLYPSPFVTCDLFVSFPSWLPLHKWLPMMFDSNHSNCLMQQQYFFLSLEISQWTFLIFISYLILSLFTITSQYLYSTSKIISKLKYYFNK